ncbi:MAG: WS/DGAT domain-containing protein, partial [Burkholderiaceae bacterium]
PKPLFLNGSRLDYFMPLVGPSLGTRMTAGFMSYAEEIFVALVSTRSVAPDIDRLARLVDRSFRELERASPKRAPEAPVQRASTTKSSRPPRTSAARAVA